jgi:4-carboxymuconolactone decarboxylase
LDYIDHLRHLSIHADEPPPDSVPTEATDGLAQRDRAIARFAALVATGGADASYSAAVDEAVRAQVSSRELVDVILGVTTVVGMPRAVSAARRLVVALELDVDTVVPGRD